MKAPAEQLGAMIVEALDRKGFSQTDLAAHMGYPKPSANRSYISRWINGHDVPPFNKVGVLCRVLELEHETVLALCAAHRWGPLEDAIVQGIVKEQIARYEAGRGRKRPKPSELAQILTQLSPERRQRVEETALRLARQEVLEQGGDVDASGG